MTIPSSECHINVNRTFYASDKTQTYEMENCYMRKLISALLLVTLLPLVTGCGMLKKLECSIIDEFNNNAGGICRELNELWEGFLDEINAWSDTAADHSVTQDDLLKGKREKGLDNYVGIYEAEYTLFNGKEYIFGGTSLKRKLGNNLKVTYSLTIISGTALLYWLDGDEKHIIANATATDTYEFIIHAGGNFIVLEGDHFTGNLSLSVESPSPA